MFKWLLLITLIFFSENCFANFNEDIACEEKKEQQRSLLTKMSTSLTEAHLAGQCTGYYSFSKIDWKLSCSEFMEQKNSLLSSLSTSLLEANLAGMCVGAIFRVAERCKANTYSIDYSYIAGGDLTLKIVKQRLGC